MKNEEIQIPCPGGGKPEKVSINNLCSRSTIKTQKGEYKFKSYDQNNLKRSIDNLEKYQKEYQNKLKIMSEVVHTSVKNLLKNADVIIRK